MTVDEEIANAEFFWFPLPEGNLLRVYRDGWLWFCDSNGERLSIMHITQMTKFIDTDKVLPLDTGRD